MWETARDYLSDVARDLLVGWLGKGCLTGVLGLVVGCLGGWDKLASGLLWLMSLDFALGFYRGWAGGCLSIRKFRHGLAKFVVYFLAIFAAATLDSVLNVKATWLLHIDFRAGMVMYLAVNETISVLGHLNALGLPLSPKIIRRLQAYRDCTVLPGRAPGKGGARG
jgi:Phage-related holin (Lysis protein)